LASLDQRGADIEKLAVNTDGYTPGDVELAAQRAAAAAFDRIREGIEPSYISADDLDAAIARTRPSVTSEICQRFGDEADRFARV
jgi:SpoVK/Ycf46/Vps4 family AAA+-type ATPase